MSGEAFGLLVLALLVAACDWYAVARRDRRLHYLCRPLVPLLLIAAVLEIEPRDVNAWAWFLVALALSLAGDVLLLLPRDLFRVVVGLFLMVEVAYAAGLAFLGMSGFGVLLGAAVAGVAFQAVAPMILQGVEEREPALLPPVKAHMGAATAMLVAAVAVGRPPGLVGAAMIYASAVTTGWDRFVRGDRWRRPPRILTLTLTQVADPIPVLTTATYHLGQIALVLALV